MTASFVSSIRTSRTTLMAIGFGRTGERTENVPRGVGVVARCLHYQVAPRLMHEIEQDEMRAPRNTFQRRRIARLDVDGTFGIRTTRVLRAFAAFFPRRADAADEIDPGIERVRQRDRDFARSNVLTHAVVLH